MIRPLSLAAALVAAALTIDTSLADTARGTSNGNLAGKAALLTPPKVSCRIEFDGGWGEFEIRNNSVAPLVTGTKFSWKTNTGKSGVTKPIGYPLPSGNEAYFPSMFQRQPGDPDKTCTAKVM
jgi:hypothetical protein